MTLSKLSIKITFKPTLREPSDDFINLFDHLRTNNKNLKARIQLAPANLHWMTDDGIIALKEKASNEGVPMHMHLLETPYQKEYAFKRTGTTAVRHLNDLKVLGPHMTLGHGVWMTEEDIEIPMFLNNNKKETA